MCRGFMDINKMVDKMGLNVEFSTGEDLFPTKRVKNDSNQVRAQEIKDPNASPSLEIEERERQENILKKRVNNFTYGVDIYKNFQYVDIDLITPCPPNWNYFKKPNKEQLITLISSVETMGVLSPLILYKEKHLDDYTVICGHSRLTALKNLFANTKDIRYQKAPCYVLDFDDLDEYFIRAMIIDSNLSYRSMDQTVLMKAIIERYNILKRTKTYRSELNISQSLSNEFLVSKSTIYNYLCLQKLCDEAMLLLLEKRINMTAGRYLARVSHDAQIMILEHFGIENINTIHMIKLLTSKKNIKLPELLKMIETAKGMVPFKTTFKIRVSRHLVGKFFEFAAEFNKYAIYNLQGVFQTKNSKRYCNIVYNEEEIKFYLEKDMINLKNFNMVNARNIEQLQRC